MTDNVRIEKQQPKIRKTRAPNLAFDSSKPGSSLISKIKVKFDSNTYCALIGREKEQFLIPSSFN